MEFNAIPAYSVFQGHSCMLVNWTDEDRRKRQINTIAIHNHAVLRQTDHKSYQENEGQGM
jgi:hypothetical protein